MRLASRRPSELPVTGITPETAAVINLPDFPLSVSVAQLQRVVDTMVQFGMLPARDISFKVTTMTG